MPTRPSKPCAVPTCPDRAINGRYCSTHAHYKKRKPDNRPSAAKRGYDHKWRRIRAQYLKAHKYCVICHGPANEVDHITSLKNGGSHQWSNLQALCKSCHSRKTVALDGGFGNG